QRRPATEVPVHRPRDRRHRMAMESPGCRAAGAATDALVRVALLALQAGRALLLHGPDPALGRPGGVVVHPALQFLPRAARLDHADPAVPGPDRDPGGTADQRLRVHRGVVAQALAAPRRTARPRAAG